MALEEAIKILEKKKEYSERIIDNFLSHSRGEIKDANETIEMCDMAISALKEIRQYREIGTVEECKKAVKEEDILKFYYCESEDDYYLGQRVENKYYARYGKTGFTWFMSRYLPWGEHVIAPNTLWKEYTYPSEPKEIPFFEWLQGFMKKYCGGTVEECRKAVANQKAEAVMNGKLLKNFYGNPYCIKGDCPTCGRESIKSTDTDYCYVCGQHLKWDENLDGMKESEGE